MTYHTSDAEHPIDVLNLASLEGRVKERMEAGAFGYIRGGSEDEWTMAENTSAFNQKKIMPVFYKGLNMLICTQNCGILI
ncbi:L-lactate oxidase (N-terminal fragment), degenerate [Latilactobacillus sakei subsp. sakei 23K]|uniref:L-lactate oxidase (N-terminal), degenerate n=1 Tax=Latilactobacillus sakei subsp. sakei (strain 23K) TaxID=314315 RepID=Q38XW1_LATSS|nr:L-lactate oxidase (N-terminal fragment), degenerate [Latilactobacillus sakei subsp. sakei 23K]